jgi:hypothetical protein
MPKPNRPTHFKAFAIAALRYLDVAELAAGALAQKSKLMQHRSAIAQKAQLASLLAQTASK